MRISSLHPLLPLFVCQQLAAQPGQQSNDPVYGTWELDIGRSTFTQRDTPRSQRRIYEPHPDGLKATVITVGSNGLETTLTYTADYDGAPSPLAGSQQADGIILTRTGPRTATSTFTHAGIEVGTAERVVSLNGQEMTVKVELRGDISSLAHFRRVE